MRVLSLFCRAFYIHWVLFRYGFESVVLSAPSFKHFRCLSALNPWNWWVNRRLSRGARIRLILESLGPIYVKFGQVMSTRRDLLPDDIGDELVKLQDCVPPFSSELAQKTLEKAYKKPLSDVFGSFDVTPLAAASVAQVHTATLKDGTNVVVKLLRPGIKKVIERDIDLMLFFARVLEKTWKEAPRLRPAEVVKEFRITTLRELDLTREAGNAAKLKRNFEDSALMTVPSVYWDLTRRNVMVQERVYGIPIDDLPALQKAGVNLEKLAAGGVEIFFTQVFRDGFFHADMHPGNIFVSPENGENPRYLGVDFGIMGSLTSRDQRYLAENFLAFFNKDYRRVAELHIDSGWAASDANVTEFEGAIRAVCEPIAEKPLNEVSFAQVLLNLFSVAREFNVMVQPQLLLLQKTLFNVEGLGRQLYPGLNLWDTAKPLLEKFARQQFGPKAFLKKLKENAPLWLEKAPELPALLYQALNQPHCPTPKTPLKPASRASLATVGLLVSVVSAGMLIARASSVSLTSPLLWGLGVLGLGAWFLGG